MTLNKISYILNCRYQFEFTDEFGFHKDDFIEEFSFETEEKLEIAINFLKDNKHNSEFKKFKLTEKLEEI